MRKALTLLLVTASLVSCATQSTPPTYTGLPPFPVDRKVTTASLTRLGSETEARSPGVLDDGSAAVITAAAGEFEWATYLFSGVNQVPTGLRANLGEGTTELWLAYADFIANEWQIEGPFSSTTLISLPPSARSPQNNVYAAAIVMGPNTARVLHMELQTEGDNLPPYAYIIPTPRYGPEGTPVSLQAVATDEHLGVPEGYITRHEWDLDDDSVYEADTGIVDQVATTIGATRRIVRLRVTDNLGATFETLVALSPSAAVIGETIGFDFEVAVVNGNPAVLYKRAHPNGTDKQLIYQRALDPAGNQWGSALTLSDDVWLASPLALVVLNGQPACTYSSTNFDNGYNRLHFRLAQDADGSSWGPDVEVSDQGTCAGQQSLTVVDGHPALVYGEPFPSWLTYRRALDPQGSAWDTPVHPESRQPGDGPVSLVVVGGQPAIGYTVTTPIPQVCYVRASDSSGILWGAPQMVKLGKYFCQSMQLFAGLPTTIGGAWNNAGYPVPFSSRADSEQGVGWSDAPEFADQWGWETGNRSSSITLLQLDGLPAVAGYSDGGPHLMHALDSAGTSWDQAQWFDRSLATPQSYVARFLDMPGGTGLFQVMEGNQLVFDMVE